jgi:hypothetical protein
MLATAATSADSAPALRVAVPTSSSPMPRLTVLPKLRVAPLAASALADAKLQLAKTFPKAATTSNPPPLTLDVSHWQASSGGISGSLLVDNVQGVGLVDPSLPPLTRIRRLPRRAVGGAYGAPAVREGSGCAYVCYARTLNRCIDENLRSGRKSA